ncbi:MAG: serine hydrolase [Alphaproteobacteria bacterium]
MDGEGQEAGIVIAYSGWNGSPACSTALANESDQRYGLGVEIFDTKVGTAYGHAGSLPGYAAILVFFPDQQASIAVTTNDEAGEQFLLSVAIDIAQNACAKDLQNR